MTHLLVRNRFIRNLVPDTQKFRKRLELNRKSEEMLELSVLSFPVSETPCLLHRLNKFLLQYVLCAKPYHCKFSLTKKLLRNF